MKNYYQKGKSNKNKTSGAAQKNTYATTVNHIFEVTALEIVFLKILKSKRGNHP